MTVYLLVDSTGWPALPDPDTLGAIVQARLPVDVVARGVRNRWSEALPNTPGDCTVFALLTSPLAPGWQNALGQWLSAAHALYVLYTDQVSAVDLREIAGMTATQSTPRAPYRVAQYSARGVENAVAWIVSVVQKIAPQSAPYGNQYRNQNGNPYSPSDPLSQSGQLRPPSMLPASPYDRAPVPNLPVSPAPPPVKLGPARWRHLPSNEQDSFYYPEEITMSATGAAGYRLIAASHRGKTHAHQGTFREDATAITSTAYWNIMAVSDGAGTADLARVGSNLAVTRAVTAMSAAMPPQPATEDVGRAIYAGLKAAYQAVKSFAVEHEVNVSDLSSTLQLLIHWPQRYGCLLGVAHVGDGIVTAETRDGQYYLLTDPDTDPDDSSRTLFLTSGPLKQWMERTKVYQFDEPLDIVALMTDGLSGDLEPYAELLHTNLFEALRNRVLCYPPQMQESALLSLISYDRRGSFDDRTLAVLARG